MKKKQTRGDLQYLSSFASIISYHEAILLYQILPRLPLKSLLRLKLVCKKWCSLISEDPLFSSQQFQIREDQASCSFIYEESPGTIRLLVSNGDQNCNQIPLQLNKFSNYSGSLLCATNGLLLGFCNMGQRSFFICNPITTDWTFVSNPRGREVAGLAFDPSNCISSYSIICPFMIDKHEIGFEVYYSNTGKWRVSRAKLVLGNGNNRKSWLEDRIKSVFTGGKIFWCIVESESVLWFDFRKDVVGVVECPPKIFTSCTSLEIEEWCNGTGELSYSRVIDESLELWIMRLGTKDDNVDQSFEWEMKYRVNLTKMVSDNWAFLNSYRIPNRGRGDFDCVPKLCTDKEVVFWLAKEQKGGIVASYNLTTKCVKLIYRAKNPNYTKFCPFFTLKLALFQCPRTCY